MYKSFRYRLYPTKEQSYLIDKHIYASSYVFNLALEVKNYAYRSRGKNISTFDLIKQITDLKKEARWLIEVDANSLRQSIFDLHKAYTNFFKGRSKFPRFKSKKNSKKSFRNPCYTSIRIKNGKLLQPKFNKDGGIKIVVDRAHEGQIRSTTITKESTGKYFVSILCDTKKEFPSKKSIKEKSALGIDLGLNHFIITSSGEKIYNHKYLKKSLQRIKVLQRRMCKKKRGSKNQKKAYHKIALIHEKVKNQRKDFLQKLSSKLVSDNQTLCFEDLNVRGMVRNHCLAQSISDASWSSFVSMCKYKCEWYGKNFLQIPTFQPSTKVCSNCGFINKNLTLADREWTCSCGVHHDRDVNAAINIKNYCLKNSGKVIPAEPVEMLAIAKSKKQEVNTFKV